jgi:hypothetical protein
MKPLSIRLLPVKFTPMFRAWATEGITRSRDSRAAIDSFRYVMVLQEPDSGT